MKCPSFKTLKYLALPKEMQHILKRPLWASGETDAIFDHMDICDKCRDKFLKLGDIYEDCEWDPQFIEFAKTWLYQKNPISHRRYAAIIRSCVEGDLLSRVIFTP